MPLQINILVGTMTGTAQLCAQEMELALDDGETRVATLMMDDLDASVFSRDGVFLVCTSTYGQGDVPDNARALYEDLKAKRPNLMPCMNGPPRLFRLIRARKGATACCTSVRAARTSSGRPSAGAASWNGPSGRATRWC